ncbi:hypothetical protein Syun_018901 [Stephania yunnanensis]|uniref:Retrotransposon gag domain-containing protein n=1 Tax=Stephania yunnanensis TaxID=152371 RepID=A0AAP0NWT3_9MAGN
MTMVPVMNFLLEHTRHKWWLSIEMTHESNMSRPQIKHMFYDELFPETLKADKIREFTTLVEGNMTVVEYASSFTKLAKFISRCVE